MSRFERAYPEFDDIKAVCHLKTILKVYKPTLRSRVKGVLNARIKLLEGADGYSQSINYDYLGSRESCYILGNRGNASARRCNSGYFRKKQLKEDRTKQ